MSTNYPGALDTDSSLYLTGDNVQTQLTAPMGLADTTATVASTAGFAANMLVTICDSQNNQGKCTAWEHMLVTSVGGPTTLNVSRAAAGTSARTHASGLFVSVLIDSAHHETMKSAIIAVETLLGPNMSNVPQGAFNNAVTFDFAAQTPGGSLVAGGINQSVTLSPVPAGVNGSDQWHYLYISGGTGTPEAVLITGGTAVSGAASGTVTFTPANNHTGAWTIRSASAGIREAMIALGSAGGTVIVPPGTFNLYDTLAIGDGPDNYTLGVMSTQQNVALVGSGAGNAIEATATTLLYQGPAGHPVIKYFGTIRNCVLRQMKVNGNNTSGDILWLQKVAVSEFKDLLLENGGTNTWGISFHGAVVSSNVFEDIDIINQNSGGSGIAIQKDATGTAWGGSQNVFIRVEADVHGGAASTGLWLRGADNNTFIQFNTAGANTGGNSLYLDGTAPGQSTFPTENLFLNCAWQTNPISGAGVPSSNVFWPFPSGDGELIPSGSVLKYQVGLAHPNYYTDPVADNYPRMFGPYKYIGNDGLTAYAKFDPVDGLVHFGDNLLSPPTGNVINLYKATGDAKLFQSALAGKAIYRMLSQGTEWNITADHTGGAFNIGIAGGQSFLDLFESGTAAMWRQLEGQTVGGDLASAASISITKNIHHVTGTTTITTITPPAGFTGTVTLIKTDAGSLTIGGGGNVPVARTITQNNLVRLTYDGTNWY